MTQVVEREQLTPIELAEIGIEQAEEAYREACERVNRAVNERATIKVALQDDYEALDTDTILAYYARVEVIEQQLTVFRDKAEQARQAVGAAQDVRGSCESEINRARRELNEAQQQVAPRGPLDVELASLRRERAEILAEYDAKIEAVENKVADIKHEIPVLRTALAELLPST